MNYGSTETTPVISIDSTPKPTAVLPTPTPVAPKAPAATQKSSSRVLMWVIIGVVLIAVLVVARNHNSNSTPAASTTPTASATPSTTPSDTSSPTAMTTTPAAPATATPATTPAAPATATTATTDLAPVGIVAHYTSTGAAIFWYPAKGSSAVATFNVEAASNGGPFKLIATVPATQLSLNVTENDTTGWTSFRISAVYADGTSVAGKVFGLPGQYS